MSVSWDLTVLSNNTGIGGFFIRFPSPVTGMQILLGYIDDGRIVVFTDTPSASTLMAIGTYLPGETYNTRLDYNLLLDQYSVYVDGSLLLGNQPIPGYLEMTSIGSFGFDVTEAFPESQGNEFIMDNVIFSIDETPSVPEPASIVLLVSGIAGLFGFRKLKK